MSEILWSDDWSKKEKCILYCVYRDKGRKNRGIFNSKKTKAGIRIASVSVSIMRDVYDSRIYVLYRYTDWRTGGGGIARKKGKFKKLLFGIIQSYFFESRFILNLTRVLVVE